MYDIKEMEETERKLRIALLNLRYVVFTARLFEGYGNTGPLHGEFTELAMEETDALLYGEYRKGEPHNE